MITDKTPHYELPLPHAANALQDDVLIIREAIAQLDSLIADSNKKTKDGLAEVKQQLVAATDSLSNKVSAEDYRLFGDPGSKTEIEYTEAGRVAKVTDTVNGLPRVVAFLYSSGKLVKSTTTYDGREMVEQYHYDAGKIIRIEREITGAGETAEEELPPLIPISPSPEEETQA